MSSIEITSNDSSFLNLITDKVYIDTNKFILDRDIETDESFYNILELFQTISECKLIEKIHKFEFIKLKIDSLPQFNQRETINIENNFNLPPNFIFSNSFMYMNLNLIKKNIDIKIINMECLKICINTIFKYIKNKRNKIEYDSLIQTLQTYKSILNKTFNINSFEQNEI
mgnify:CR=1 FL=1